MKLVSVASNSRESLLQGWSHFDASLAFTWLLKCAPPLLVLCRCLVEKGDVAFIQHSTVEENTGGTWLSYCMGLGGLPPPVCILSVPKAFILDIHFEYTFIPVAY